ncbi:MAG: thiol-disulfide oxidoreductase DCC family protein [Ignavibacteriae bacterium]|jgi:predicted DCC family thiol-disulfide oxidoreductase YuxK|nr:thiol-disulfide oxidoreductase DCC family protein [Ignavibacteriota bacterium]NOG98749.1 thiol-disulfide oxidoreductase DCC family protein [Ignavibacteriota bacterium]
MNKHVILFDGVCNLCNGAVRFIIKRDKHCVFKFASLQSSYAEKQLGNYSISDQPNSVILIKNKNIYVKSEAAFEIIKELTPPWKILLIFKIFPKSAADFIYDLIAKYRYKIFGKKDSCPIPDKSIADRFIND